MFAFFIFNNNLNILVDIQETQFKTDLKMSLSGENFVKYYLNRKGRLHGLRISDDPPSWSKLKQAVAKIERFLRISNAAVVE